MHVELDKLKKHDFMSQLLLQNWAINGSECHLYGTRDTHKAIILLAAHSQTPDCHTYFAM